MFIKRQSSLLVVHEAMAGPKCPLIVSSLWHFVDWDRDVSAPGRYQTVTAARGKVPGSSISNVISRDRTRPAVPHHEIPGPFRGLNRGLECRIRARALLYLGKRYPAVPDSTIMKANDSY